MAPTFVIPLWADLLAIGIGALQGALRRLPQRAITKVPRLRKWG